MYKNQSFFVHQKADEDLEAIFDYRQEYKTIVIAFIILRPDECLIELIKIAFGMLEHFLGTRI